MRGVAIIPLMRELVYNYLDTVEGERSTQGEFLKTTNIKVSAYYLIRSEYFEQKFLKLKRFNEARVIQDNIGSVLDEEDPEGWWKKRKLELNQAIMASAKKGNAQSQKLAKQLAGELIEKQEVKIGLSADEVARRNSESGQELREFRKRLG